MSKDDSKQPPINRVGVDKATEYDEDGFVIRSNKQQAKRDLAKIREVAEGLIALPNDLLESFLADQMLLNAIIEGKKLKGDAKVRQLQYITKQLNRTDFDTFSDIYLKASYPYRQDPVKMRQIDDLIELLLTNPTEGIEMLQSRYKNPDVAHVRTLLRNMTKEKSKITPQFNEKGELKKPKQTKSEKSLRKCLSELLLSEK